MLKMIDLTNAGLLLFGCTVCDACVKNSSLVRAVYSDLSWGKIQKAHCVFVFFLFFFARSQGCWDNLEIRSLPEAKIVFASGQNYLTLLSNSQMIFHCNIPWFQNAWTYTSMSKLPSNGALYLNQESQSMKTHPIYTRFVSTCSDVRCVC